MLNNTHTDIPDTSIQVPEAATLTIEGEIEISVKLLKKIHKSLSSKSVIVTHTFIIFYKLNLPWNITITKKNWKHKVNCIITRIKLTHITLFK